MPRAQRLAAPAAVLLSLLSTAALPAGLVFSDGFEDGTANKWQQYDNHDNCAVVERSVDGVAPHSGRYMLECNWNGAVPWTDSASYQSVELPTWPYQREFLVRAWVRFTRDVTRHAGSKIFRLFPNSGKMDSFTIQPDMSAADTPIQFSWILNHKQMPSFWGNAHTIGDGKWHRLEVYVAENRSGASDGTVRVWLDGALLQELVNEVTIAPGDHWSNLHLMSNWTSNPGWDHGANNHVDWDDIELFSDAATGAGGQMRNATISATASSAATAPAGGPVH